MEVGMTYGDVHVHIDASDAGRERLRLAARIAAFSGAHVTGYFINVPPQPLSNIELMSDAGLRSNADGDELRVMVEARERELWHTEAAFKAQMKEAGIEATWSAVPGDSFAALNPDAVYGDLTILGDAALPASTAAATYFAGRLAYTSGRPVLRLSSAAKAASVGTRILIAWKESREAARAVADAIPLLKQASFVALMQVVEPSREIRDGLDALEKIVVHLRHFGIRAERYVVQAPRFETGREILAHADRIDADLVVMGAYGHSPLDEAFLGGVTRSVLKHAQIPLFLSH